MIETQTYQPIMVLRADPTRTLTLRNSFARDMNKRFNELMRVIRMAVVDRDVFGLVTENYQLNPPMDGQFNYPRSQDKGRAFMDWLRRQENLGILETRQFQRVGDSLEGSWTDTYIWDSYKRGVIRARYELNNRGYRIPTVAESGGIEAIMASPFHADRVGLLFTRVFEDLNGVISQMDTQISRVLSQGLIDGDNPRLLARKLVAVIDGKGAGELGVRDSLGRYIPAKRRAEMIARTEVIRAHHQANIREYMNWEVEGVQVVAEFVTAGDDRVCPECAGYHGNVYSLETANNMIPVHPMCRCIVIPIERSDAAVRSLNPIIE